MSTLDTLSVKDSWEFSVSLCGMNALLYCAVCIEVMNVINTVPFPLSETEIGFLPQETFYKHVIGEVCRNMREAFMNEGVDEQVLTELKEVNAALRCFSVIVKIWG